MTKIEAPAYRSTEEAKAWNAGYAFALDKTHTRAPALDRNCMALIPRGTSVGDKRTLAIFRAWRAGFQARCDEEAEAILKSGS